MTFLSRILGGVAAPPARCPSEEPDCLRSAARTDVGKVRALNEDRFVDLPQAGFWAIADGMGGHRTGDVAAQKVADALRALAETGPVTVEAAAETVREVNSSLFGLYAARGAQEVCGSTFVALILHEGRYECLWAGDSRAYLSRNGLCRRINRDHSVVQEMVDAGLLAADEARGHPRAHVITRAVGVAPELDVDVTGGAIEAGDLLLLCSDGLSDLLEPAHIEACLEKGTLAQKADALLAAALDAGAPDNVTLILVQAPR